VTTRAVRAGEVLEVAGLLILPKRAEGPLDRWGYVFDTGTRSAVAAGVVSFANHSYTPNARYDLDGEDDVIELSALADLPAGTEVLVNYNGDPDGDGPLWFDVEG
jgi:SET domain-containing protein